MPQTYLVIGAKGLLGRNIFGTLSEAGKKVVGISRQELDVTRLNEVSTVVKDIKPTIIFNCAAYTNVERAETDGQLLNKATNADFPAHLAHATNEIGAHLIHFSTDYVFDGNKRSPYTEGDATQPLNLYGKEKLNGEIAVANIAHRFTVLRLSWLFDTSPNNLVMKLKSRLDGNGIVYAVEDQVSAPTNARYLASDLIALLDNLSMRDQLHSLYGTFHYAADGECNVFQLANFIQSVLKKSQARAVGEIVSVSSSAISSSVQRPEFSKLDNTNFFKLSCRHARHWKDGVLDALSNSLQDR